MNIQVQAPVSAVSDIVKHIVSAIIVIAGVSAFYYFAEDIQLIYRVLGLIVMAVAVVALLFTTSIGQESWVFIQEARREVKKVVWPTREETWRTTLLVIAMVFIVGMILWLLDMLLFWGITSLTGQGG
jgi:preprotein translocase subunit SecE